jgi:hypothetical protein
MKKTNSLKTTLIWIAGITLMACFVFLTVETATSGAVLAKLENQEASLMRENADLNDALVRASSLNGVEKKSVEMGFVKPSQILYINSIEEVANLP